MTWRWTIEALARVTGGTVVRAAVGQLGPVGTDTRRLAPGAVFVALVGTRHDGHAFCPEAARRGASAVVVRRDRAEVLARALPPSVGMVAVDDTLEALGALAADVRRRWGGDVVGITGSCGKSTVKELVAAALHSIGPVLRNPGNWNNRVGLPLSLLAARDERVAVLEMGTSEPGEIARLAAIAAPRVGVLTLVGPAHLEGLGTVAEVAREKGALLEALPPGGAAVYWTDDPHVVAQLARTRARPIGFGRAPEAAVRLVGTEAAGPAATRVVLEVGGARLQGEVPGIGPHMGRNAAAAVAAALAFDVAPDEALDALRDAAVPTSRLTVRTRGAVCIVDDAYNSNPASLRAALDAVVERIPAGGRLVAVLGEMRELGRRAEALHRQAGQWVADAGAAWLVAVGPLAAALAEGARAAGVPRVDWVPDADAAAEALRGALQPGDWVLVKGSRAVGLERVVAALGAGEAR